ncbi:unnamed protein product [Strongylus vulgaris]|uniref:Uncharacterized protein n=1 Tax=Strongylus vulgaris TaxID=40348 RepID=A0A3P7KLI2_STRVU|nr:unnamed protein product [Strongylus vulgaris]
MVCSSHVYNDFAGSPDFQVISAQWQHRTLEEASTTAPALAIVIVLLMWSVTVLIVPKTRDKELFEDLDDFAKTTIALDEEKEG